MSKIIKFLQRYSLPLATLIIGSLDTKTIPPKPEPKKCECLCRNNYEDNI